MAQESLKVSEARYRRMDAEDRWACSVSQPRWLPDCGFAGSNPTGPTSHPAPSPEVTVPA